MFYLNSDDVPQIEFNKYTNSFLRIYIYVRIFYVDNVTRNSFGFI